MRGIRTVKQLAAAAAVGALASFAPQVMAQAQEVALSGANESPAVQSGASGTADVTIGADHSVKAKVVAKGMTATASHIHEAPAGANGPVIVPFVKTGDNTFESSPGAKLTDAQYEAYKAGKLYVNVHSAAHPAGEIRGQLVAK